MSAWMDSLPPRVAGVSAAPTRIALALGGHAGARLARLLATRTSPSTPLRRVHRLPTPSVESLRVLGVDDWAWPKGRRWGTLAVAHGLVRDFRDLLRRRASPGLGAWKAEALASQVPEGVSFARGLGQEAPAVAAAFSEVWSHGPTEGPVHRLKLVKRSMYGRSGFDLLRQRVLLAA